MCCACPVDATVDKTVSLSLSLISFLVCFIFTTAQKTDKGIPQDSIYLSLTLDTQGLSHGKY